MGNVGIFIQILSRHKLEQYYIKVNYWRNRVAKTRPVTPPVTNRVTPFNPYIIYVSF